MTTVLPRRFALVRHIDYTGVSGVGVVAYGITFSDGHVALRWCSSHPATSIWESLDHMLAVHGHGEATSIQWIDAPVLDLEEVRATTRAGRRARRRAVRQDVDDESSATTGPTPGSFFNGHPRQPEPAVEAVIDDDSRGEETTSDTAARRARTPGRHRRSDQGVPR